MCEYTCYNELGDDDTLTEARIRCPQTPPAVDRVSPQYAVHLRAVSQRHRAPSTGDVGRR